METCELLDLPRAIRLRAVVSASHAYIAGARNRTDAALATVYLIQVLMRTFLGWHAREDMPVPSAGGWKVRISRATERFETLVRLEAKKLMALDKAGLPLPRTKIYTEYLAARNGRNFGALLSSHEEFRPILGLLSECIELLLRRSLWEDKILRTTKRKGRKSA